MECKILDVGWLTLLIDMGNGTVDALGHLFDRVADSSTAIGTLIESQRSIKTRAG